MNWGQWFKRHSELLLVLAVLVVISGVFHWIPHKLAFLSFFYLPVLGAGYLFGARRAVLTGVLCVLVVTVYYFWAWTKTALASEAGLNALATIVSDNTSILLNLALWGGFLILTGAIVGRVQEKLAASYEKSQALNQELAQRASELQALNEALQKSADEIRERGEQLQEKDQVIEELKQQTEEIESSQRLRNRRRSDRVFLVVPVEVAWMRQDGTKLKESAKTEVVSAHGALLCMDAHLPLKTQVVVTHRVTQRSSPARVVGTQPAEADGKLRVAVELDEPSEAFWGVSIPTSA
jgi:hypothetical protein